MAIGLIDWSRTKIPLVKSLFNFFGMNGYFTIAYKLREIAIDKAISLETSFLPNLLLFNYKITALIEKTHYKESHRLLSSLPKFYKLFYPINKFFNFFNFFNNSNSDNIFFKISNEDNYYRSMINNKSIAIVGPSPSSILSGTEIDSYDFVIRTAYKGENFLQNKKIVGSKTDISYFNTSRAKRFDFNHYKTLLVELKYVLFKKDGTKKTHLYKKLIKDLPTRTLENYNQCLFSGALYTIPYLALDFLSFSPSKIKIFCVSLYYSNIAYHHGYDDQFDKHPKSRIWWGMNKNHDLITNYRLIKNLFNANKIRIDEELLKILSLNESQYLSKIEYIYSN